MYSLKLMGTLLGVETTWGRLGSSETAELVLGDHLRQRTLRSVESRQ